MKTLLLFLLLLDVKQDYLEQCKKCHESASQLFSGKLQTKDLRKTIFDMYRRDSSEIPSKSRVDAMYKYAKSFQKKK